MPGPPPKRSEQRRRANAPALPITTGEARKAQMPAPSEHWHPLARDWYVSLGNSGQSDFYQESDWLSAKVWTSVLSEQLHAPKMSAVMMQAWASASSALLATEGDRRRMRLELSRTPVENTDDVEDDLLAHRAKRTA